MTGTYPIIINGENVGEIDISQNGVLTTFEALCEDSGDIVRLALYGESEGYLGVMLPRDGKLCLKKSLTKLALEGFPQKPTHAGNSGGATTEYIAQQEPEPEAIPEPTPEPETETESKPEPKPEPEPEPEQEQDEDLVWQIKQGGVLTCVKGESRLIALPYGTPGMPMEKIRETRMIEGAKYAVFKVENNDII